jgi:hypothetical protein
MEVSSPVSCHACLTPQDTSSSTHSTIGWVVPEQGLMFQRKLLPLWDSKPRLSNPQTNHHYDSVIPAPVILFWACHNQKCILSLLTLDNSEQLPQSSFLWYHHDSETSTLALSGTSLKGWKFTSATLTRAGHVLEE